MILTGKASHHFVSWVESLDYVKNTTCGINKDGINLTHINMVQVQDRAKTSFIIEWLDTVGLFINVEYDQRVWFIYIRPKDCIGSYNIGRNEYFSRQEATKAAIEKANELYNGNK